MIKIAVIHPEYTCRGGAERKSLIYARELAKQYAVTILCGNFDQAKTFSEYIADTPIIAFPFSYQVSKFIALWKIAKTLKVFDLVIANNHPVHYAAGFAAWWYKKPVIWFCNEPALYMPDTKGNVFKRSFLRSLEKLLVKKFQFIIANSQNTRRSISNSLGIDSQVIYSGIDFSGFPEKYPERNNEVKQLVLVSRLEKHKQVENLFPVFDELTKEIAKVELTIIGRGSYEKVLREKAGSRQINFITNADEQQKIRLLAAADVYVFPTLDEPLGVTPMEAQACGCPVVAFKSGGVQETVLHEKTGILVKTADEFVAALVKLLKNPQLAAALGKHGIEHARKIFSQEKMVAELKVLIENIASSGRLKV